MTLFLKITNFLNCSIGSIGTIGNWYDEIVLGKFYFLKEKNSLALFFIFAP